MDAARFDAFAITLATRSSRRQIIKHIIAGVATGFTSARITKLETVAAASAGLITWPFQPGDGGQWAIASGYRQGDHVNSSRYGLDFARCTGGIDHATGTCDGFYLPDTREATVYAPVSGPIAWGDDDCAGLAINVDGTPDHRLVLIHIDKAPSLPGQTWTGLAAWKDTSGNPYHFAQGDPIGTVSATFCHEGTTGDHIHMHLYRYQGADTPREERAFVDTWAISGCKYPEDSAHGGKLVPCAIPGGLWSSPIDGVAISEPTLHFAARAYPAHTSDPQIDYVNFTMRGPNDDAWQIACTANASRQGDLYACDANLAGLGVPPGPVTISFDVYDNGGNYNLAPHGLRTVNWRPDPGCPRGQTLCSGACVDPRTNASHCGTCGNRCGLIEICSDSQCCCDGSVIVPGWCMGATAIC